MQGRVRRERVAMPERWAVVRRGMLFLALFGTLICFLVDGYESLLDNSNSSTFDQRSYLTLGLEIRSGKHLTDGNRHPLYPALLALFARRSWSYFTTGKLLSLGLGVLSLLIVFWVAKRLRNEQVALVVLLLLSINPSFRHVTSHVMAEALLVGLFALAWYLGVRALDERHSMPIAGAAMGIVYLTKGTGQLMAIAFLLVAGLRSRRAFWRAARPLLSYLAAYILVTAPLWIYNLLEYENPLYNWTMTHAMWFDSWEDKYAQGRTPTLWSYLRQHSVAQIVERQWYGMGRVLPVWRDALVPKGGEPWLLGLGLLGLGLPLLVRPRAVRRYFCLHRVELLYTGVVLALFYFSFAWFAQVYVAPRFFVPLAPMIYFYLADGLIALINAFAGWLQRRGFQLPGGWRRGFYLLICTSLIVRPLTLDIDRVRAIGKDPYVHDRAHNAEVETLFAWIRTHLSPGIEFLWGPSTTFGSWYYENKYDFSEFPSDAGSWAELSTFVRKRRCAFAIVDSDTFRRREDLLSPWFSAEVGRIHIEAVPSNWALTYVQPDLNCRWAVFQILDQKPISNPLPRVLGQEIRFLGYDLAKTVPQGGRLCFTLYWQAMATPQQGYTVFTHLLGTEGKMIAQEDHPPIEGRVPTNLWIPGAIYADRYAISLPDDAPLGQSRLEVGLYLLATMERLPVMTPEGQRLAQDRILLPTPIAIVPVGTSAAEGEGDSSSCASVVDNL